MSTSPPLVLEGVAQAPSPVSLALSNAAFYQETFQQFEIPILNRARKESLR